MNPSIIKISLLINDFITISDKDAIYLIAQICNKSNYFMNATRLYEKNAEVHPTIRAKSNQNKKQKSKKRESK
jgi:hypothetical protein